jgi:hypothetical protein
MPTAIPSAAFWCTSLILTHTMLDAKGVEAAQFLYACEVTSVSAAGPDGKTPTKANEFLKSVFLDEPHFSIDRQTGRVLHPFFGLVGPAVKHQVLNAGDKEWSFKAISYTPGYGHVLYVEVDEYAADAKKPMRMISNGAVATGVCQ